MSNLRGLKAPLDEAKVVGNHEVKENVDDEHCRSLSREAVTPVNEHLGVKGTIGKKTVDVLDNPLHLSMSTPCHQQLPAFKDNYASPQRPALKELIPADAPILSPASASRKELNDAALTLTWLSEARISTKVAKTSTYKVESVESPGKLPAFEEEESAGKGPKRAASRKCTALLKEALFEERQSALVKEKKAKIPKVTLNKPLKAKKAEVGPNGEPLKKRRRNYSSNSRVGRAVQSIFAYITEHQPTYLGKGARGVPERVIRQEFGNNPDTSKALRYLVTEDRINREGRGGRRDPFSYTIRTDEQRSQSQLSSQENGEPVQESELLKSLTTPTAILTGDTGDLAASAAILTAPSTMKQTDGSTENKAFTQEEKLRRPLQPRLSFGEPIKSTANSKQSLTAVLPYASISDVRNVKTPLPSSLPREYTPQADTVSVDGGVALNQQVAFDKLHIDQMGPRSTLPNQVWGRLSPADHAAYLMHLHAVQLFWSSRIMGGCVPFTGKPMETGKEAPSASVPDVHNTK